MTYLFHAVRHTWVKREGVSTCVCYSTVKTIKKDVAYWRSIVLSAAALLSLVTLLLSLKRHVRKKGLIIEAAAIEEKRRLGNLQ